MGQRGVILKPFCMNRYIYTVIRVLNMCEEPEICENCCRKISNNFAKNYVVIIRVYTVIIVGASQH